MRLPNPFQRAIPLDAPLQPGEHKYTTLQLSRVVWRIFRSQRLRALFGLVSVAAGVVFAVSSIQAVNDIVDARTEGRRTTCASDRRFEEAHNDLVQGNENFITTILGDSAARQPADQRQFILDYAAARVAEFETTKVPLRDCSPDGIAAFYEKSAPKAAPCPSGGDTKGFCK